MLIHNNFSLIYQLNISLVFNTNGEVLTKNMVIKNNDIVNMTYIKDGEKKFIKGKIIEINSTYDRTSLDNNIESYIYIVIDGSDKYIGDKVYINPKSILDIDIL